MLGGTNFRADIEEAKSDMSSSLISGFAGDLLIELVTVVESPKDLSPFMSGVSPVFASITSGLSPSSPFMASFIPLMDSMVVAGETSELRCLARSAAELFLLCPCLDLSIVLLLSMPSFTTKKSYSYTCHINQ